MAGLPPKPEDPPRSEYPSSSSYGDRDRRYASDSRYQPPPSRYPRRDDRRPDDRGYRGPPRSFAHPRYDDRRGPDNWDRDRDRDRDRREPFERDYRDSRPRYPRDSRTDDRPRMGRPPPRDDRDWYPSSGYDRSEQRRGDPLPPSRDRYRGEPAPGMSDSYVPGADRHYMHRRSRSKSPRHQSPSIRERPPGRDYSPRKRSRTPGRSPPKHPRSPPGRYSSPRPSSHPRTLSPNTEPGQLPADDSETHPPSSVHEAPPSDASKSKSSLEPHPPIVSTSTDEPDAILPPKLEQHTTSPIILAKLPPVPSLSSAPQPSEVKIEPPSALPQTADREGDVTMAESRTEQKASLLRVDIPSSPPKIPQSSIPPTPQPLLKVIETPATAAPPRSHPHNVQSLPRGPSGSTGQMISAEPLGRPPLPQPQRQKRHLGNNTDKPHNTQNSKEDKPPYIPPAPSWFMNSKKMNVDHVRTTNAMDLWCRASIEARKAMHELELADMELNYAACRTKATERSLELARAGTLGMDAPAEYLEKLADWARKDEEEREAEKVRAAEKAAREEAEEIAKQQAEKAAAEESAKKSEDTAVDEERVDAAVVDVAVVDVVDAAMEDAAVADSAVADPAVADSAVVDAVVADAPVVDAPVTDEGVMDAGEEDAAVAADAAMTEVVEESEAAGAVPASEDHVQPEEGVKTEPELEETNASIEEERRSPEVDAEHVADTSDFKPHAPTIASMLS
ncbi:hypothetical protein HGRIS_013495 [Hohenbuehelia grisea]|uniref:Uncharacterized protein n=1 Tax=Hohenbuehelia grisea TaxID=104357 RepID=A0ABR3IVW1_9AGAR